MTIRNAAKITPDQVIEIRRDYGIYQEIRAEIRDHRAELKKLISESKRYQPKALAEKHGLTDRYVYHVAVGDSWSDL